MKPKVELAPVPEGLKVKIFHVHTNEIKQALDFVGVKGKKRPRYYTFARLIDRETQEVLAEGDALCSYKDTPSRKLGRAIAHNRALKAYTKATNSLF